MIPVEQTKIGGPEVPLEEQGNCVQACIASIFEIPLNDAPSADMRLDTWAAAIEAWADKRGYAVLWDADYAIPHAYGMRLVKSFRGDYGHAVVTHGTEMVWDPSPDRDKGTREDTSYGPMYTYFIILDPSESLVR